MTTAADAYSALVTELISRPRIETADILATDAIRAELGLTDEDHLAVVKKIGLPKEDYDALVERGQRTEQYCHVIKDVLADRRLDVAEHGMLDRFRKDNNVSQADHDAALDSIGWTPDDFTNSSQGLPRAAVLGYRDLLVADPGEAQTSLERFALTNRIQKSEHAWALQDLGFEADALDAKQFRSLKTSANLIERDVEKMNQEIDLWENRLIKATASTGTHARLLGELHESLTEAQSMGEKVETDIAASRRRMSGLESQLVVLRETLKKREQDAVVVGKEAFDVEDVAEDARKELGAMRQRIMQLTGGLDEADGHYTDAKASRLEFLLHPKQVVAAARAIPTREDRELKMFKTSVVAVVQRLNVANADKPPISIADVDVDDLYADMQHKRLTMFEWNAFITGRIVESQAGEGGGSRVIPDDLIARLGGLCVVRPQRSAAARGVKNAR